MAARCLAMSYMPIEPVTVWETISARRTLADVEGAANFLLIKWPRQHMDSEMHRAAQVAALDALGGHLPAADFRTAFVAAAKEADIYAES